MVKIKRVSFLLFLMTWSAYAFADDGLVVSNDFPNDGLMLENHVYKDSAIFENLGVYEGNIDAIAEYEDSVYNCMPGYYVPAGAEDCVICPENNYCVGGDYYYDENNDQGITACSSGLFAPMGMWESAQCGHKLHVGDDVVYLHAVKKTTPSLNVKYGEDVFYGNMTVADIPMNNQTERKLKVGSGGAIYSVYDDSIDVNNE